MSDLDAHWMRLRPRLLAVAVNILGSVSEAEDAVSEAWLRTTRSPGSADEIADPAAWLTAVTARIALDMARSAARSRVGYVGPWLPEVVSAQAGPEDEAVTRDLVNLATIRLIQSLEPVDRVILVLHDVFGVTHRDIAGVVNLTPAACRQRLSRARRQLAGDGRELGAGEVSAPSGGDVREQRPPDAWRRLSTSDRQLVDSLGALLRAGDLGAVTAMLSEGCVLWTDAGGTSRAALRPILGRDKVMRFVAGLVSRYGMPTVEVMDVVGAIALRLQADDLLRMVVLEVADGAVTGIQVQQNPAKIRLQT